MTTTRTYQATAIAYYPFRTAEITVQATNKAAAVKAIRVEARKALPSFAHISGGATHGVQRITN